MLFAGVVLELERRDNEEDEVHEESNHLHLLATIQLVVDEKRFLSSQYVAIRGIVKLTRKIVSHKRNADIDQIVQPARHDGGAAIGDHCDEFALEQLVPVEENIIGEPSSSSRNQSRSKVGQCKFKRFGVISGDFALLFRYDQLLTG